MSWLSLFLFFVIVVRANDPLLHKRIIADEYTHSTVKDAIEDMRWHLSLATTHQYALMKTDSVFSDGIFIVRLHPVRDSVFYKRMEKDNQDVFLIEGDGKKYVRLMAFTRQGLVNAIYTYLDLLGFKWYHPGNEWMFVPKLTKVSLKINSVIKPDFLMRSFFGTFGTPRNRVIDKDALVDREWNLWAIRNRLGGSYSLQGHAWGYLFWRHISEFVQHPEYTALVDGKRSDVKSGAAKFCVTHKALQELFVKDRVEELKKKMKDHPSQPVYCISVEPSDGEGFCECDGCKKLGSVSNQVFSLANLTAKAFQQISDRAYVNLYAYNKHAAPPDFPLENNVVVQIIPYGYQDYTSPDSMFAHWKSRHKHLFIYDYYGLPILNLDKPLIGEMRPTEFVKRIRYWHQQGIRGITLESSYSIAATGIGLYLFARTSWDITTDEEKVLQEYYSACYGKAASVLRAAQLLLGTDTLVRDKETLRKEAVNLIYLGTKNQYLDSMQELRLSYYRAYLHYLRMLYALESGEASGDSAAVDALLNFTYGIFFTKMVHPLPVSEWLKNYGRSPEYVKERWDTFNPAQKGSKYFSVRRLKKEETDELFLKDAEF